MSAYVFICETRRKAPCWARQADSFPHLPLTTPQGQLRLELLRLESESSTAQPISAQLCSFFFFPYQHCIPQSSAVIKHLKGSVNWDDGIENDTEYLSVRVGEYFGPCVEKRRRRQICRQRQMWLDGCECLCLHLKIVLYTSATPHCSFPLQLCQCKEKCQTKGDAKREGSNQKKCLSILQNDFLYMSLSNEQR